MRLFKSLFSILGVISPVHITWFNMTTRSKLMGADAFGNKYYEGAPRKGYHHTRRWVVYKGAPEASAVPPEWHGWLHHQTDVYPSLDESAPSFRRNWQQPHRANATGTDDAYMPPGHQLKGGKRDAAGGDYEAWTPPQ